MTFQQLSYVVEAAKCGSINRAATNLFTSQSSVSNAISQLEFEFQVELFTRSSSGVILTESGKRFISYAISILERKSEMESLFLEEKMRNSPSLHFFVSAQYHQCSCAAFSYLIDKMEYSEFQFSFRETDMGTVMSDVANNRADIGIVVISSFVEGIAHRYLKKMNLSFTPIAERRPSVFCSKHHPLAMKEALTLDDIRNYPYVRFSQTWGMPVDFSESISKLSTYSPEKQIITCSRIAMTSFLCNTNAVSTGSGLIVDGFTDSRLISIPLTDATEVLSFGWISPRGANLNQISMEYIKILGEVTERSLAYTQALEKRRLSII